MTGAITTNSTFDGRNVSVDGTKLDGIETGATADQTAAQILTAIKTVDGAGSGLDADLLDGLSASDFLRSNAADVSTVKPDFQAGIETGSGVTAGVFIEDGKHHINSNDGGGNFNIRVGNNFTTGITEAGFASHWVYAQNSGLWSFKSTTASQAVGETPVWQTALGLSASGDLTPLGTVDGRDIAVDGTKLDGIEAGADVTDTANVTAAGALMDSEVDADIKTLVLPASTTISAFGRTLIDDAAASNARTTLGLGTAATTAASAYATAAQGTKADAALQPDGDGSALTGIVANAGGAGNDEIFWENGQNVTTNYTITNGKNAMSAGPITINSGITVTVGDGEIWTVI